MGLTHSGVPCITTPALGEPMVVSLSMDFFFVPRLRDDNERGKRERNAGVEVFCGWGCGKSGEVADENGGYEVSCNKKERQTTRVVGAVCLVIVESD